MCIGRCPHRRICVAGRSRPGDAAQEDSIFGRCPRQPRSIAFLGASTEPRPTATIYDDVVASHYKASPITEPTPHASREKSAFAK